MHEEVMIWFAQAVAHSLWHGGLIGLLAWLAWVFVRGNPAKQHLILGVALVLVGACLPVNLAFRASQLEGVKAVETTENVITPEASPLVEGKAEGDALITSTPASALVTQPITEGEIDTFLVPEPKGEDVQKASAWKTAAPWIVAIYGIGLVVMSSRLLLASGGTRRLKERSRAITESAWVDSYRAVLRRLGLQVQPALRWSEEVAAPVLVGVFKPMVILPVALANRLSPEQAEAVLAHELAHLRRHDHWALLLQRLVETICFYHPVVWLLSRQLHRVREQACDDLVLATGAQPADYAESLVLCSELRLMRSGLSRERAVQLAATGPRGSSLRQRVLRVLGESERVRSGRLGWLVSMACALALVGGGVALVTPAEANPPQEKEVTPEGDEGLEATPIEETKAATVQHVVQRGDTLYSIAKTYATSVVQLKKSNPQLKNAPALKIGEMVVVPARVARKVVIASLVLAEVPVDYEVKVATVKREVLEKSKEVKITSMPRLAVASGEKGTIEIGSLEDAAGQGSWLSVEVTPTLGAKTDRLGRRFDLSFDLRILRKDRAADGVVRSQEMKTTMNANLSQLIAIDGVPLRGGKKLVGSVEFSIAKVGAVLEGTEHVFDVLPNGNVLWRGREFREKAALFHLLPEGGKRAVVRARPDTPFKFVVALSELLERRYQNVSFSVMTKRVTPQAEPAVENEAEEEEARRIANCHSELRALQFELDQLIQTREPHHPEVRRVTMRIQTIIEYLKDVESSKKARIDRAAVKQEMTQLTLQLAQLQRVFTDQHPRVLQVKKQLETLRDRFDRQNDIDWSAAQIRELEGEIAAKLANGLGERHPSVVELRRKMTTLKAFQKSLQGEKKKTPRARAVPKGETPPASPEGLLPEALPRLEKPESLPVPEDQEEEGSKAEVEALREFDLGKKKADGEGDAGVLKKGARVGEGENLLDPLDEHAEMKSLKATERELELLREEKKPNAKRMTELEEIIESIKGGSEATP